MCHFKAAVDKEASGALPSQGRQLLPSQVVPQHYHLTLEPDFEKLNFEGSVIIDLAVSEDTNSISLHTLEIEIHSSRVTSNNETISDAPKVSYNEDTQTSTFDFEKSLTKGSAAQLEIKFTGQLNDKMAGFYRSKYKGADGSDKLLATTQFEATDARRAFPCFDEPSLKAKFTVTLIAEKHLTCLSNMDVKSEGDHGSKKAVTFNPSPLMSTYLVAFIVGELEYIETKAFRVPIRVYSPAGTNIEHGRFALDLSVQTLEFYEKTFGIDYPLPKMDNVSIPDFAQGAMENWGLVTYRTVDLMFDPETSGASMKERVAETVQHELAHQWFGNLVTMAWWDGLWLNEGFATWASWYSSHTFFPEWNVWQNFVTDTLQPALGLDSLRSSHPIEVPVKRADEINQIFDSISYGKGSSVLRMISAHLGEDTFIKGVQIYLKKNAYGNTETTDLWAGLSEASGKPVEQIMETWTKNIGHPLITVTEQADGRTVHVKQNRFIRTGDIKPEEDEILYPVFLNVRSKRGIDRTLILKEREASFQLPEDGFFKINADHSAFYRVMYTQSQLQKLSEAVKNGLLSVEDRCGLLADTGSLATAGHQRTSGVLTLVKGFNTETEFAVWKELITRIQAIRGAWFFEEQAIQDGLMRLLGDLVRSKTHELGWNFAESDGHIEQQFKALLFGVAGLAGDEMVISAARDMFRKYAAGHKAAVPSNLRRSVFQLSLKVGGEEVYDQLLKIYKTSSSSDEKNTVLGCLGSTTDPKLLQRTFGILFSDDIKDQDVYLPIFGLREHGKGMEAGFQWMKDHWDLMYERLPPALPMLGIMVKLLTNGFTTATQLEQVQKFFEGKNTDGYDQSLAQSVDSIKSKMAWVDRDREDVAKWLKDNGYLA